MKHIVAALALLFSVPANAFTISLGTPFVDGGKTYVPVVASGVPDDALAVYSLTAVTTGSVALGEGSRFSSVWPQDLYSAPGAATQVDQGVISLIYEALVCNIAQASGMLGAFEVTGVGTVRLEGENAYAVDCFSGYPSLTVGEGAVSVNAGGGGGGGGCCHEDPVVIQREEAPKVTPVKPKRTWGAIKALYR